MRKRIILAVVLAASLLVGGTVSAYAVSVTGGPAPSTTWVTAPSDLDLGTAAPDSSAQGNQVVAIRSNVIYGLTCESTAAVTDQSKMNKWDSTLSQYVEATKLNTDFTVAITDPGIATGSDNSTNLAAGPVALIAEHAKAPSAGGNTHTITVTQPIDWNDEVLTSPDTYKVELTWTLTN